MKEQALIPWMFFLAAAMSMVAAVIPVIKGGSLNVVFFCLAIVWFILGLGVRAKARKGKDGTGVNP